MASSNVTLRFETLVDLLHYRCQQSPERIAYDFWDTEQSTGCLTYKELDTQARNIASALQSQGLAGQRVLLFYQPGLDYIAAFWGCLYAGAVAVPIYAHAPQKLPRLQGIICNAKVSLVLTNQSILETFDGRLVPGSLLSRLAWLPTDTLKGNPCTWCAPDIYADTLALLQYTSGSTGMPKGSMVTHGNLLHNLEAIYQCFGHSDRSQGVIWLPPYHDMGLIGGILQPVYGGFPVALMSPHAFQQNPLQWLKMIAKYRATTSGAPDFAYRLCVEKAKNHDLQGLDLSSWEVAFNGAEPICEKTLQDFAKSFAPYGFDATAFYPCYGMAEATLFVSGGDKRSPAIIKDWDRSALERGKALPARSILDHPRRLVSCGQIQSEQQMLVVDPDTRQICEDRVIGEIWLAGPSIVKGYWNRPKATQQLFHAYLADNGAGPFFRTGDLGFLDNHELFITGRLKDMLIMQGRNHSPYDIEFTVKQSHPAIYDSCGAAMVVDVKGEERLIVIQEVEYCHLRHLNSIEVINAIRSAIIDNHQLAPYAIVVVKTGSIPKTSSGKVKRYACRAAFLSCNLVVVDDWFESPRYRTKFQALKTDVDFILESLTVQPESIWV